MYMFQKKKRSEVVALDTAAINSPVTINIKQQLNKIFERL